MRSITVYGSIWSGSGSCTRMPSTVISLFSWSIRCSKSLLPVFAGRSCSKESIPASAHALRLFLTYMAEAGSSPTWTTASPGARRPFSMRRATSWPIFVRISRAMDFPSISWAGMNCFLAKMVGCKRETYQTVPHPQTPAARKCPSRLTCREAARIILPAPACLLN